MAGSHRGVRLLTIQQSRRGWLKGLASFAFAQNPN
jgi:hypothetical protein